MFNKSPELRRGVGRIGIAVALGLGLTACGKDYIDVPKSPPITAKHYLPRSVKYFGDGSRIVRFHDDYVDEYFNDLYEYCEGTAYMQMAISRDGTNGITRTPDAPECADGKLTPEDFKIHPHPDSETK